MVIIGHERIAPGVEIYAISVFGQPVGVLCGVLAMEMDSLIFSSLVGLVGSGFLMFGKSTGRLVPIGAGLGLMIVPFFGGGLLLQGTLCTAVASLPFVFRNG